MGSFLSYFKLKRYYFNFSDQPLRYKRAVDQEFLKNKLLDIQNAFEDVNTLTFQDWSSNFGDNIYHGFEKINKTYHQIKKDKE